MLFCGQCGLQLAPGSASCPRCGSVTQPALPPLDNPYSEDPTIASDPRLPLQPPQTPFPQVPGYSPLPPSPGSSNPYATEQMPGTPTPSPLPTERVSHPGYPDYPNYPGYASNPGFQNYPGSGYSDQAPPAGVNNSTQRMPDTGFPPPGSVNYPSSTPGYTDFAHGGNAAPPPQEPTPKRRGNGGLIALLLVLLVVGAVAAFLIKPAWLFGSPNNTPTPTATTANVTATPAPSATATTPPTATATSGPTAVQQAQATVQSYYTDINNRDYQSAYNLWYNYPQTEAQFASGFTNTIQDSLTITSATQLPDGTVQVSITLVAQSTTGTTTYSGYYIVQQYSGSWMIQRGHLA